MDVVGIIGLIITVSMGLIGALWTVYTKNVKPLVASFQQSIETLTESSERVEKATKTNSEDINKLANQMSNFEKKFEKETHTNGGSTLKDDLKLIKNQVLLNTKMTEALSYLDPNPVFKTDSNGNFTFVNYKYLQLAGFQTQEDALGHGWLKAVHTEDRDRVEKEWTEAIRTESVFESEFRYENLITGKLFMVSTRTTPVRDSNKDIISYIGVLQILF